MSGFERPPLPHVFGETDLAEYLVLEMASKHCLRSRRRGPDLAIPQEDLRHR